MKYVSNIIVQYVQYLLSSRKYSFKTYRYFLSIDVTSNFCPSVTIVAVCDVNGVFGDDEYFVEQNVTWYKRDVCLTVSRNHKVFLLSSTDIYDVK